ncbi:MAG: adenylate/guanylate cyclase domain-containing protein [Chitinophagaceae bacterium]
MRKLSAVLFADIAGYTAMMQEDEKTALQLINKFKKDIEDQTGKFNGRIVQYYGDGCLLTFESSTEAVDCAISLQNVFNESPVIPVRIGIHMGEIMFRNNGAFGNGVNIASRIESMGIPGSILVSKTIRDQIVNKSSFLLASLGTFEFKNVSEPMEVFALANEGFVIPDKSELVGKFKSSEKKKLPKWLAITVPLLLLATIGIFWYLNSKKAATTLTDKQRELPVAVMVFENLTKDKSMDDFGLMIKDWLSYGLLESEKAPIIILDEEKTSFNNDEKEKFESLPTGVGIVINGRFVNQSDEQISTVAEILDVKTKKILFTLKPVVAEKDSIMFILDQLKNQVISYWGEITEKSEKKPPLFAAYAQYLNGLKYQNTDYLKAQAFYQEAIKQDATFITPLFALATSSINNLQPKLRDSVMATLQLMENSFTPFEKKNWENLKAKLVVDSSEK